MDELREYIVTLHNKHDLDQFYDDMETPGGSLYIPNRAVDVANRRPISRNTHYWLSDQEAQTLRNDPRVRAVELTASARGIEVKPVWFQSADYVKTFAASTNDKNWGLLRCALGEVIPNWGVDVNPIIQSSIVYPIEGLNVDVVIVDGIIKEDHAEFTLFEEGGPSRIVQFNWFSLNPEVNSSPPDDYSYVDPDPANANHGTHVAGIAVGNTQGWARKATIYNISPYGLNSVTIDNLFDYIRAWHNSKTLDPVINEIRPTICNNSWASFAYVTISQMNDLGATVTVRGITYTGPWDEFGNGVKTWQELGFDSNWPVFFDGEYYLQVRADITATIADIEDCIDDGIHIVFAAGNDSRRHDKAGGLDVDNRIEIGGDTYYINRHTLLGSKSSAAIQAVVDVGAIGATALEPLATFTNRGPAVDMFAPGSGIVSAYWQLAPDGDADDPRGQNGDRIASQSGTSMAAPQVTGVMACYLELNPTISPADLKAFMMNRATAGLIDTSLATTNEYDDEYSLQGAQNLTLFAPTPTVTVDVDTTFLAPGDSVTATITTTDVPDGSVLYLIAAANLENFDGGENTTTVEVNSNSAEWTVTASTTRTGEQTFSIIAYTGGFDGAFQANSVSITLGGTYTFNVVPKEITEGAVEMFSIVTTGVANGTVLYWTINHVSTDEGDFKENSGSFTIQNNAGSFSVRAATDIFVEDQENFTVSIRTTSTSGTVRATSSVVNLVNDIVTFNNTVTTAGSGLWLADTIPAYFLRSSKSYSSDYDPRLPNYAFLTQSLPSWSNAEIKVSNISIFPSPSNITANATVYANTYYSNGAPISSNLLIPVSSIQGLSNGYKLITANITSEANTTIQRIFPNSSVLVQNLVANSNIVIASNEICYFYPKVQLYRNLKTVTSNTAVANVLLLRLESLDNISIGTLVSTSNIIAAVSDDTLTTIRKIFRANNSVLVQNIDANLQVSAGEYVTFNTRPTVGAIRVRGEIIWYERIWTANSTLTNLTRSVGGTPNSGISANLGVGNLVSVLGLQTVSS